MFWLHLDETRLYIFFTATMYGINIKLTPTTPSSLIEPSSNFSFSYFWGLVFQETYFIRFDTQEVAKKRLIMNKNQVAIYFDITIFVVLVQMSSSNLIWVIPIKSNYMSDNLIIRSTSFICIARNLIFSFPISTIFGDTQGDCDLSRRHNNHSILFVEMILSS